MQRCAKAEVETVIPGSIAAQMGIAPGDVIAGINGQVPLDLIDYRFAVASERVILEVAKPGGERYTLDIGKDYDEDLGVGFTCPVFDGVRRCHNACLFCFVDQLPPAMRHTLYVKDDDYRLSFLYGNFITLTNLTEADFARIVNLRLSPLYISVHTTDGALRRQMLGQPKAALINEQLETLSDGGIEMHTQIVLCPGVNDGERLEQTLRDLKALWPAVRSVAVVPVGITRFRAEGLRGFNRETAAEVLAQVTRWQERCKQTIGNTFVFLADEFYLLAGVPVPDKAHYEDFPQVENGVGLVRLFLDDWRRAVKNLPAALPAARTVTVVTGVSGGEVLKPLLAKVAVDGLKVDVRVVENRFFGPSVTVTGLLTGQDILAALTVRPPGDLVIIPAVALRDEDDVFLDGMTPGELAFRLQAPVLAAGDAAALVRGLRGKPKKGEKIWSNGKG